MSGWTTGSEVVPYITGGRGCRARAPVTYTTGGRERHLVSVPVPPALSFRVPRGRPVVPGPSRGHAPLTASAGVSPVFVTALSVTPAVFRPCRSRCSSRPARVVRAKLMAMKISAMTVKVAIVLAP